MNDNVNVNNIDEKSENGAPASMSRRRLFMGGYGLILCVIAVAAVIVVNMLVRALPTRYTKFDLTEYDVYKISDKSKEFLSTLKDDVTVYFVTNDENRDMQLSVFLDRYAENSPHITVREVDPDGDPAFIENNSVQTMNSIVVESAKRTETVDYYDIFEYSDEIYSDYYTRYYFYGYDIHDPDLGYVPDVFDGDGELTSAIDYVTTDDLPPVCYTSGHGESSLPDYIMELLDQNNMLVSEVNIMSSGIPADADAIMIIDPASDFSESEVEDLIAYFDGGGSIILVTDPEHYSSEKMPNITSLAKHMGLLPADGVVVEGDDSMHLQGRTDVIYAKLEECLVTEGIENASNYAVILERPHGIIEDEAYEGGLTHRAVMKSSETSFLLGVDEPLRLSGSDDVTREYWIGAVARNQSVGNAFIWYASDDIVPEAMTSSVLTNNVIIFLQSPLSVCGKAQTIEIDPVATGANMTLTFSASTTTVLTAIVQFVIPLLALIPGFVVWFVRRRR